MSVFLRVAFIVGLLLVVAGLMGMLESIDRRWNAEHDPASREEEES